MLKDKALTLLGQGVSISQAAAALGVSDSYVSQLMAQEEFSAQVATLRFNNLQAHNTRDAAYDELEDMLITKMKDSIPLLIRPMEIRAALKTVNDAKRRGSTAPPTSIEQHKMVQINLPPIILQNYTASLNALNQVVSVGSQDITTMQSATLKEKLHVRTPALTVDDI